MFGKKNMVDERQELQSLKNAKTCWTIAIFLLACSTLVQMGMFVEEPMYYFPEAVILLVVCVINLILEIKNGLVYTSAWSNPQKNYFMYFAVALAVGVIIGVRNYVMYDFPASWILLVMGPVFATCLVLMLIADRVVRAVTCKRLQKLEREEDAENGSEQ